MMNLLSKTTAVPVVTLTLLSGCAINQPQPVTVPAEVTVEAALLSVGRGLHDMRKVMTDEKFNYGLYVDEVTLTLNLGLTEDKTKSLGVDLSRTLAPGSTGTSGNIFGFESAVDTSQTRGSTLVVKLRNIATVSAQKPVDKAAAEGSKPTTTNAASACVPCTPGSTRGPTDTWSNQSTK